MIDPGVWRVASAHLIVDGFTNIYAPLLPLLIPRLGLSLRGAGALAMVFQLAASVSQLGFGRLADRWHPRRLLIGGPILTVVVLSFIGLAPSIAWLMTILVIGGLGAAAFHPPGAMFAHRFGGERRGLSMSVFVGGGMVGFGIAPMIIAPLAERYGPDATLWMMPPALAWLAYALRGLPDLPTHAAARVEGFGVLRPYARPLGLLFTIVVLRTVTALSFATFVPVMLTRQGLSLQDSGLLVAGYLFASSVGGFLGGPMADRFGHRTVIAASLALAAPLLVAAPHLNGPLFAIVFAAGGFFLQSTLPVNVSFGQSIAPVSAATVSSLMMGVAWGTGGIMVPVIGEFADRVGIENTLSVIALTPLLAAALSMALPKHPGPNPVPTVPVCPDDVI